MTEKEFHELCERTLRAVEDALDACGCDVETSRSGNVLEIEFDDGSRIIVSGNLPVRELWVAARSGGFHFRSHYFAAIFRRHEDPADESFPRRCLLPARDRARARGTAPG